mmetsp:Transcript_9991/g.23814  ORF Transcript_9991/g.23814 Transcript_9991/m.23814 type:complete len:122 (+) Transcript_9991:165-530(+)
MPSSMPPKFRPAAEKRYQNTGVYRHDECNPQCVDLFLLTVADMFCSNATLFQPYPEKEYLTHAGQNIYEVARVASSKQNLAQLCRHKQIDHTPSHWYSKCRTSHQGKENVEYLNHATPDSF